MINTDSVNKSGSTPQEGLFVDPSVGLYGTLDNIISVLKKLNAEIRDLQREHFTAQQGTAFRKEVLAITTKAEAIEKNYEAAVNNACAKIFSGVISCLGAGVSGGLKVGGIDTGDVISTFANGMGKVIEGGTARDMANVTREAQLKQAEGEFQSSVASEYYKSLAAVADKAADASRQMMELTRELMSIQERITSAVRI